jgi:hypothetical protein
MKPRTCFECKKVIPIDSGFSFNNDCGLICSCGKIVIPTTTRAEYATVPQPAYPAYNTDNDRQKPPYVNNGHDLS